jgi:hypothetical protein
VGILSRLLLGKPRTDEEVEDLVVDAKRFTIAGLGAGATLAEIEARLGPPDSWLERRGGRLVYSRLGLRLQLDRDGKLAVMTVIPFEGDWTREGDDPSPFRGRWLPWESEESPTEKQLVELHGEPKSRESDDEELSLEWELGEIFLAADFRLDGKLRSFWVDAG